jgi:hypothetical protein
MARRGDSVVAQNVTQVVVTDRPKAPPNRKILETPPGDNDVQVIVMGWAKQAFIRTMRTYLQALVGNLTNIGIGGAVAITTVANLTPEQQTQLKQVFSALEFYQVLVIAASTAVAPAVVAFLQNAIEILAKLDNPETRA